MSVGGTWGKLLHVDLTEGKVALSDAKGTDLGEMTRMADILIVDDESANLKLLSEMLGREGYRVRPANSPQLAIKSALGNPPDLMLLDVRMPDMDGFEVCGLLKHDERTRDIPILFISALQDTKDKVRGFEAGGVDFISKPFQEEEVLARVRTHLKLHNMQRHLEELVVKRTDEAIASEERFRVTFERAGVGIAHVAPNGRFLRLNKKYCDIFGFSNEEMVSMTFMDVTHSKDLEKDLASYKDMLAGIRDTYATEKRYIRKDGSVVWCELAVSTVRDQEGNLNYFVSILQDISDRIRAQEASHQSHNFLENLTKTVPDAIFTVKLPERIVEWCNDSYNILGYAAEECVGKTTEKFYANKQEATKVGALIEEKIHSSDELTRTEVMLRHKEGHVFPAELNFSFYREGGEAASVTALVRNISFRKKALEALKKSESRLKQAQRIAMIGNWKLDLLTHTFTWSDEVFRIFEVSPKHFDATYEAFLEAIHPDDRDRVDKAYTRSLKNRQPYGIDHRLRMPDGRTKFVYEQCETVYNSEGTPLSSFGTIQDITELKDAQNESIRLRLEMAHLNRIMTMNELAASFAHEINQPLGAIVNNASTAKIWNSRSTEKREDLDEILDDIAGDARHAGLIISKIRGIMKKGDAVFHSLDINILLDEVLALYQNAFSLDRISVSIEKAPNLLPIKGDRVRLQQVLMNLITNAMDAMANSPQKAFSFKTSQSEEMVKVSVSDTGSGVKMSDIDQIFDPFYTTKEDGMGIGLRLCESIIEEHGGRIWAENNPDGGTTFCFTLKVFSEGNDHERA